MTGDPWTTVPPQDLRGLPHAARISLDEAAAEGRYLDAAERDRIIAAAGANPDDWQVDRLPQTTQEDS
ncbi:hypothetical protein [Isoptericola sp. NPDC056134]|uniref:hypothetical protein n=1 Tax=Isoptericola sp. NPDC056134 TaxID=3345723 RepID=UPI0035ECCA15